MTATGRGCCSVEPCEDMVLHGFGIAAARAGAAGSASSIGVGVMTLVTPTLGKWRSSHCRLKKPRDKVKWFAIVKECANISPNTVRVES